MNRRPTELLILILAISFLFAAKAKAEEPDWKLEALQARRMAIIQEQAYLQERYVNIINMLKNIEKQLQEHMAKTKEDNQNGRIDDFVHGTEKTEGPQNDADKEGSR